MTVVIPITRSALGGVVLSMKHDAAAAQKYRRCLVPHAQQQRRPLDEDVELDDGDSFGGAEVSTQRWLLVF